ncbi:MAG: GDSL-type esterase/lipase family protein [Bacteroidota bacterium]|mgnify:FL=1
MNEPELGIWRQEISALKQKVKTQKHTPNLTAFYGSSSIRLWETMSKDLAPYKVINLGFGGSTFGLCSYFFDEVFEHFTPREIVLYGGDNDLSKISPRETVTNLKALISKIIKKYENPALSLISIKPSPERAYLEEQILLLNEELKRIIEAAPNGRYIDIHPQMLDPKGDPIPELFMDDQLHMNSQGYKIWKEVVTDHLKQRFNGKG